MASTTYADGYVPIAELQPTTHLERANAVSMQRMAALRAEAERMKNHPPSPRPGPSPVPSPEKKIAKKKVKFNKRRTYAQIRSGKLRPTDPVPGLPGTSCGELLVKNLCSQFERRQERAAKLREYKEGPLDLHALRQAVTEELFGSQASQ